MMRVRLSTKLALSAEAVITLARMPALLSHIAAPVLRFVPVEPATLPEDRQSKLIGSKFC